jgi:putative ABC transport system permease protein
MSTPLLTDVRTAARSLRHAPTVAVSAIACLALGIGATVAIASAIDRALLERLPFREPDRLVTVYRTTPHFNSGPFSAPNYTDLARESRRLASLAAATHRTGLLALRDGTTQLPMLRVTGNLFPTLGVRPLHGRLLTPDDDRPGQPLTVVFSHELWHGRFGGDPSVVGSAISINGEPHRVVGVLPPAFRVPHGSSLLRAQLWVPMRFSEQELGARRSNFLMALGRLAPGATPAAAQAELTQLFDRLVEQFPQLRGESLRVLPLQAEGVRAVRTPLLLLFGAVVIVLLIASTNVASLLLARGVQREREIAIRAALGGSRWTVVRPVLTESVVIAVVGLLLGLALAWIGVRTIGALAAERVPQLAGMQMNPRILAFALVLSGVVALVCGAAPAWRSSTVDPQDALRSGRGGGTSRAHHRALNTLVVAEVALSLMLLLSAGLVLKGFANLLDNDPGFETDRILTLEATVAATNYPDGSSVQRFLEPALASIRQIPGVETAAAISLIPYTNWGWNFNIRYEGQPGTDPTRLPLVENRVVTPSFFEVTRQRLVSGRLLRQSDDERDESPAVVVVNEALARRDFGGRDPVGKRFHRRPDDDTTFTTIVGVVSDIRNVGPVDEPRPEVYRSYRQGGRGSSTFPIMVRVRSGNPANAAAAVQRAIRSVDPGAAVASVMPMADVVAKSLGRPRFYLTLLGAFAAVAVVLAVAGIYGVMSYAVAQRTRELGIRMALGSTATQTVRFVARQGMWLVAVGIAAGFVGAAFATRLLVSLLYGVSAFDPTTWAFAALLLAAAGLVATLVPSLRATRVDPAITMRVE